MRKSLQTPGPLRRALLVFTWLVLLVGLAASANAVPQDAPDTLDADDLFLGPPVAALDAPAVLLHKRQLGATSRASSLSYPISHPPTS